MKYWGVQKCHLISFFFHSSWTKQTVQGTGDGEWFLPSFEILEKNCLWQMRRWKFVDRNENKKNIRGDNDGKRKINNQRGSIFWLSSRAKQWYTQNISWRMILKQYINLFIVLFKQKRILLFPVLNYQSMSNFLNSLFLSLSLFYSLNEESVMSSHFSL